MSDARTPVMPVSGLEIDVRWKKKNRKNTGKTKSEEKKKKTEPRIIYPRLEKDGDCFPDLSSYIPTWYLHTYIGKADRWCLRCMRKAGRE